MACVEWVMACDLAYFDREARLCMVGVTRHLLLPSLPVRLRELMLVAHITDVRPGERLSIGVAVSTPGGQWIGPSDDEGIHIEVVDEYILAKLHDFPLTDEGTYRFALRVNPEQLVAVDIPVFSISPSVPAEYH